MRATISTVAFLMLIGCGGRTLLDDPNDELPLPDGGKVITPVGTSHEDAGTKEDAGSTGSKMCGKSVCTASQDCCGTMSGMSVSESCVAKGTCTGATVTCMSASDCSSGDICCATLAGGIAAVFAGGTPNVTVDCAKACGMNGFQICAADTECPKGVTCQSTPFGESLCGGISAVLGDAGFGGFGGAIP
jgi:hypothetical protein